jgi:hypothetical protein
MWEREYHHLNLDEGEHTIGLIERGVEGRNGPARHLIQIRMGEGEFSATVGRHSVAIKLGEGFTVAPDGTLTGPGGEIFDPAAFEKQMIAKLNAHHAKLRAYARRHGVPEYKGPKK